MSAMIPPLASIDSDNAPSMTHARRPSRRHGIAAAHGLTRPGSIHGSQRWLRFGSSTLTVARPSGALGLVGGLAFRLVMAPEPSPG